MGLKKVRKLIDKINVLYDSLLSIDEEISPIEKDLLLNYIRQLYEQVLEIGTEEKAAHNEINYAREVMDLGQKKPVAPVAKEEVIAKPAVEEISDIPTEDTFKVAPSEMPKIEKIPAEPAVEVLDHPITMTGINEELVEMFEMKEARDVSEKLSSTPIKDLNTAMGINDRFLTVNELFGGDANAFKACVDHINGLESYEDAKSYLLSEVAQKFDWSSAERLKKAAGFITLVQRRFR